ncbi:hypothetical protein [Enterococcus casseliflavus]|uniref:hypothetical protein n=1 Tax=Enterococcus casseliflavus TaxID=37734 RepID=UPI0022E8BBD0|nr:hypothetical protein [Enterococcus casseliflavus]
MERINDLLSNPEKYELSPRGTDALRELKRVFEGNPFFPMEPYAYAKKYLHHLYSQRLISGDLMESILNDF